MKLPVVTLFGVAVIVGATLGISHFLEKLKPEALKKTFEAAIPAVEVVEAQVMDLAYPLSSEGVVTTKIETVLSAEVSGKIVEISENFNAGALYQKGEVVAKIDPLNYETAVSQARSAVANAELALKLEQARSEQSKRDWLKISPEKEPSEMILRTPHLKSAQAHLTATEDLLEKALKDLERTTIRAPFSCRLKKVSLNLGATVSPGTPIAVIYDPKELLVRLPLSVDDSSYIQPQAQVQLSAEIAGVNYHWPAKILWNEGEIDRSTLSTNIVVQVGGDPLIPKEFRLPPPGLFVKAQFEGKTLKSVIKVPRSALRRGNQVTVLNGENKLEFRKLQIVYSGQDTIFASEGLQDKDLVIVTRLEIPREGMSLVKAKSSKG